MNNSLQIIDTTAGDRTEQLYIDLFDSKILFNRKSYMIVFLEDIIMSLILLVTNKQFLLILILLNIVVY